MEFNSITQVGNVYIRGIMEHIERAGVHTGDSIAIYPPQRISEQATQNCIDATITIAKHLQIKGLINIQFIIQEDDVYVIEVNPRASRTIPDRKSTRLNSSHVAISYAVFCL